MSFSIAQANLIPAFHAGYCIGIQGGVLVPSAALPPSPELIPREWANFLDGVRSGRLTSRGRLNEGAEACADAFMAGALEVFPEAGKKIFLKTLGRVWGATRSPIKKPLALPVSKETLAFSQDVGRHGGGQLRADYGRGLSAGLGRSVLDAKLHLRNMDDYLATGGWYLGKALFIEQNRSPEKGDLLLRNRASVIHRAFHAGKRSYPEDVVELLPSLIQSLDIALAGWFLSNPDAAETLAVNRDAIINRALHSGNLKYPREAVKAIPGMLKTLEGHATLLSNRASIVSRALNRGNFRYPEEAAKRLPELFAVLDREIARLNPYVSKTARVLEANRATIVMRALANGDFRYPEKVVKELPRLLRALEREIARLAGADPETAEALRARRRTVIDRALNSGILKITGR